MSPNRTGKGGSSYQSQYIREINNYPMLDAATEQDLCRRWRDQHDVAAAHRLACSHIRLVVKIAAGYRGYGLASEDLVSEGQVGLMRALCRFDPDHGVRFATYAIWWIRAAMQEFILHNWSMVKLGTTASQKKLFFNLRRVRAQMQVFSEGPLSFEHQLAVARRLGVPQHDVAIMNGRMAGPDFSLNIAVGTDSPVEWQSLLVDEKADQEVELANREEAERQSSMLSSALERLTPRERHIVAERHLKDRPTNLEELSRHLGVSRERVRQVEMRAITKLQRAVQASAA
jgi:RNA polymerase sigma-32 factor